MTEGKPLLDQAPDQQRRDQLLRERPVAWLSTVRPSGRPHVVPVWFVWIDEVVVVLTRPSSQKALNIQANSACSLALDDSNKGKEPVVFDGRATLESAPIGEAEKTRYFQKYDAMLDAMQWSADQVLAELSQVIRITPIRFVEMT